jgi:hypothetical protein
MRFDGVRIPPWRHNKLVQERKAFKRFILATATTAQQLRRFADLLKEMGR